MVWRRATREAQKQREPHARRRAVGRNRRTRSRPAERAAASRTAKAARGCSARARDGGLFCAAVDRHLRSLAERDARRRPSAAPRRSLAATTLREVSSASLSELFRGRAAHAALGELDDLRRRAAAVAAVALAAEHWPRRRWHIHTYIFFSPAAHAVDIQNALAPLDTRRVKTTAHVATDRWSSCAPPPPRCCSSSPRPDHAPALARGRSRASQTSQISPERRRSERVRE